MNNVHERLSKVFMCAIHCRTRYIQYLSHVKPISLTSIISNSVLLGNRAYGVIVLIVECLGASTVILYGLNLLFVSEVPDSEVGLLF